MIWVVLLLAQAALPPQIERGQSLFFDTSKGCATCHALQGRGTAVGPDLKPISRLSPRAIATAVRSTVTQYVQMAKYKDEDSFPAMPGPDDGKIVQLYDLSKTPPELRKLEKDSVKLTPNASWKHPPAVAAYSNEDLAALIAYIRYATHGDRRTVQPSEVE